VSPSLNGDNWPKRLVLWFALTAVLFIFVWFAFELVLLTFAGILLAILLHTTADWVERHTPKVVGPGLAYTTTVLGIVATVCLLGFLIVPRAIAEASEISQIIPQSIAQIKASLEQSEWGRYVVHVAHRSMNSSNSTFGMSSITAAVGGALEGAVVVLVVGFYGALNARQDTRGLLLLVPSRWRERTKEVAGKVVYTLRWWLIGQMIPMSVLGAGTMIGLWLLGVPLAFTLGLLTGLMIFIPYVGSWIAFVPTVLVALTRGTHTALYVTLLYLALHGLEGYVLTPLAQKRAVLLPPVLTILSQLLLWRWVGLLGVAVATPLAAAGLALVKVLYLHEDVEE
jgi:predicted PurR-regulated permease PerM